MFNPIDASENIKDEYIDYLRTFFRIEDKTYSARFSEALRERDAVAKGPYLEVSDSYKKGETPRDLIERGELSELFKNLEGNEFHSDRPLYTHQVEAIEKTNRGRNIIVTTGTGSGKTECFVLPIINSLLKEIEAGTLDDEVRAILIYPMNALANDQMKRFRELLNDYPQITFGVYNSSTRQKHKDGVQDFESIYRDGAGKPIEPSENEIVSRDDMRKRHPHILVTNYAMLEYIMLRPGDDDIISNAKLRFLVLDEAHIYRGATGIETAILLKRLKARIREPEKVQNILTSATLGNGDCDGEIVKFAETLCGAPFSASDIIRSETESAKFDGETKDVSLEDFAALADPDDSDRARKLAVKLRDEYSEDADMSEIMYDLCGRSELYREFREAATGPMTVPKIADAMRKTRPDIEDKDVVNIAAVASRASKSGSSLAKIRYHMFAKALEGAYVTLGKYKNVLLKRREKVLIGEDGKAMEKDDEIDGAFDSVSVFECAVCDDCGRMAIFAREEREDGKNKLKFAIDGFDLSAHFYFVYENGENPMEDMERDEHPDEDEEEEEVEEEGKEQKEETGKGQKTKLRGNAKEDYVVCTKCGAIFREKDESDFGCGHDDSYFVKVRRVVREKNKNDHTKVYAACPACPNGKLRLFYPGYDATTSVLGTALFEELPEYETTLKIKRDAPSIFGNSDDAPTEKTARNRQFLAFADSRSDAAFFASYMSASYKEFLRRRGMVHVLSEYRANMEDNPWDIGDFVSRLAAYFDSERTFAEPRDMGKNLTAESTKNAWIAVLNEMVNASRPTSLVSLGFVKFGNKINTVENLAGVAKEYGHDADDVKALFDQLIMDAVAYGAVEGDGNLLSDDDREYVYYSAKRFRVKKTKGADDKGSSSTMSWKASPYPNGNLRMNGRLKRVMRTLCVEDETEANELLGEYWEHILKSHLKSDDYGSYFLASEFTICAAGGNALVYRCAKCGRVTTINCENRCPVLRCDGTLEPVTPEALQNGNHYVNLYNSSLMKPFHIREHTGQLGRKGQKDYQEMFVKKEINSLSCSTTFELGVDVGDLETVYMRNVPPTPANYVQRAGRAGRNAGKSAYSLTYAKLGSHDFTFYNQPENMISGKIGVPFFTLENEKIVQRHVYAVALSAFFKKYPEVYNGDDADVFLNGEGRGWEKLCEYLDSKPEDLKQILKRSIPASMQGSMEIDDFSWTDRLIGEDGILTDAVRDYDCTVAYYDKAMNEASARGDFTGAGIYQRKLRDYRKSKREGDVGAWGDRNMLIEFFVRNNVLPKYGFPVDTVELRKTLDNSGEDAQLTRDLQLAVSEYAPSSRVVADGMIYTSRYIRKAPPRVDSETKRISDRDFDTASIAQCRKCGTWNCKSESAGDEQACISCGRPITRWEIAIEPRMGFVAGFKDSSKPKKAGMRKPQQRHADRFSYIGNPMAGRNDIDRFDLSGSDGAKIHIETSRNDSLMRVCDDPFFVCPECGYAESASEHKGEKEFSPFMPVLEGISHSAPWGKQCGTDKLYRRRLCHVFKTDVVKVRFTAPIALPADEEYDTVLSVMYALLEAMATEFDIERDDIAGCLHPVMCDGELVYSLILYDAVAGGAGHVRRLVTEDGDVFSGETLKRVADRAIKITHDCTCSPSCYNCLRNYRNRDVHNHLNRHMAYDFLNRFCREIEVEPKEK